MSIHRQLKMFYFAIVAVFAGIAAVWVMAPRERKAEPLTPPPETPFVSTVAASGLIEPRSEFVSIANPVPGVIAEVRVRPRDFVEAGDVLYVLETRHLLADLDTAKQRVVALEAAAGDAHMRRDLLENIDDPRAIRKEELESRRFEADRRMAELETAKAEVQRLELEIERQHVRAPMNAEVLRVEARPGEYAPAGRIDPPLVLLGDTSTLHVRADIPEDLAWRIGPGSAAKANPRGRGDLALPVKFVRFEPYVRPKQSLTGNPDERVDTRVVQAIYELPDGAFGLFAGQQVDVFIEQNSQLAQQ